MVGGQLLSCGLFLCFSISDCKERILVAGLYTDLVRGTKTAKEKKEEEVVGNEIKLVSKPVKVHTKSTQVHLKTAV